jgi:hypothetical protein
MSSTRHGSLAYPGTRFSQIGFFGLRRPSSRCTRGRIRAGNRLEYTLEELAEIVETLSENHESLSNYAREVGLIDRRMDLWRLF